VDSKEHITIPFATSTLDKVPESKTVEEVYQSESKVCRTCFEVVCIYTLS
jgi:hypothetical protein